jgi:hypothetical protein
MRLPWHCYRVLVKGHARRRKDAAAQVGIHEVNSDRPIAHADLAGCRLADVNVLAGEQRRSSAQETESLMDLAGCLSTTLGFAAFRISLTLASSASVLSSLASYMHALSRILDEENKKMTTRRLVKLEASMTYPSVAASAEVAVYASWAEILMRMTPWTVVQDKIRPAVAEAAFTHLDMSYLSR